MADLREKIIDGMNPLEKIMSKIPGFSGYKSREQSREADKIQRTFMAKSIRDEKNRLQDVAGDMVRSGNLKLMTDLDRTTSLFDKVAQRIEHAEYGYSALFAGVKIDTMELDSLYEYDLEMLNNISGISEALTAMEAAMNNDEIDPKRKLRDIENALKELDRKIDGRQKMLKGVE